ncbi:MAG: transketolase C-terminal domain-containing protein, partial [Halanaerobiales bacterium]
IEKYIEKDLEEPVYQGEEDIEFVFLGWGSTFGSLEEAREILKDEGVKIGILSFSDLWPLPVKKLNELAEKGVKFVDVEENSTAQFARLIRSETGLKVDSNILKCDGRPFAGVEIARRFKEEVMD